MYFMQLKDGVAISRILNDMYVILWKSSNIFSDPEYFHLQPIEKESMSTAECKANLIAIIDAIIVFYDKTQNWLLESNIRLDDIFVS